MSSLAELEKSAQATWEVVPSNGGRSSSTSFPSVLVLSCCGVPCAIPRARSVCKKGQRQARLGTHSFNPSRPAFRVRLLQASARSHPPTRDRQAPTDFADALLMVLCVDMVRLFSVRLGAGASSTLIPSSAMGGCAKCMWCWAFFCSMSSAAWSWVARFPGLASMAPRTQPRPPAAGAAKGT